jgi:ribokinase
VEISFSYIGIAGGEVRLDRMADRPIASLHMNRIKSLGPAGPLVLSFGSINADIAAYSSRLPRPGETIHADHYAISLGGKGANQAAAAGRLAAGTGMRAAFAGRVGTDVFGALVHQELAGFGVDLQALRRDAAHPTGLALIGIDAAGENAITLIGGANMAADAIDVAAAGALLDEASVLLLQLEIPVATVLEAATRASAGGALVVLDPAPAPPGGLPDAVLGCADILTPNETETELLVGLHPQDVASATDAADRFFERGARGVIVKLGARGVFFRFGGAQGFVPPFTVHSIDSVAAGDIFNGGLAVALARGDDPLQAVRFAAACGALATTKRGAAGSAPTMDEVNALLAIS